MPTLFASLYVAHAETNNQSSIYMHKTPKELHMYQYDILNLVAVNII